MKVMAFDLDGTLARSKKPMHKPMADALSQLTRLLPVAIISGGTIDLVRSQVTDMLSDEADRSHMHLMPTSGARYYRWNPEDDDWQEAYEHNLSEEDRRLVIESLERHARELGIWQARTWGPRIEDRGSQITFSALGQQAPVEAKEEWDPTNEKKNRLAEAVQKDVPHLAVRSGGSTSVDISNRGVDKAYAVRKLADMLGVTVGQIAFVGDRMDPMVMTIRRLWLEQSPSGSPVRKTPCSFATASSTGITGIHDSLQTRGVRYGYIVRSGMVCGGRRIAQGTGVSAVSTRVCGM